MRVVLVELRKLLLHGPSHTKLRLARVVQLLIELHLRITACLKKRDLLIDVILAQRQWRLLLTSMTVIIKGWEASFRKRTIVYQHISPNWCVLDLKLIVLSLLCQLLVVKAGATRREHSVHIERSLCTRCCVHIPSLLLLPVWINEGLLDRHLIVLLQIVAWHDWLLILRLLLARKFRAHWHPVFCVVWLLERGITRRDLLRQLL